MILEISLNERKVTLFLRKGDDVIAEHSWEDENALSERLLGEIDNFLSRNSVKKEDIEKVESRAENAGLTSGRIIKTVADGWNFAMKSKNNSLSI